MGLSKGESSRGCMVEVSIDGLYFMNRFIMASIFISLLLTYVFPPRSSSSMIGVILCNPRAVSRARRPTLPRTFKYCES